jgi:hypothetical protein
MQRSIAAEGLAGKGFVAQEPLRGLAEAERETEALRPTEASRVG